MEVNNRHHRSRLTDEGPSINERVISTIRNLLMKPVFEKGNGDSVTQFTSVIKNYNNTIHSSPKLTPIETSRNLNETTCHCNLNDRRKRCKPSGSLGDFFRTADINSRRVSRTGGRVESLGVPMY